MNDMEFEAETRRMAFELLRYISEFAIQNSMEFTLSFDETCGISLTVSRPA